jgi:hypothetical protein
MGAISEGPGMKASQRALFHLWFFYTFSIFVPKRYAPGLKAQWRTNYMLSFPVFRKNNNVFKPAIPIFNSGESS